MHVSRGKHCMPLGLNRLCPLQRSVLSAASAASGKGSGGLTREIMERVDAESARQAAGQREAASAGGAGGRTTYEAFLGVDRAWSQLRNMPVRVWKG